MNQAASQGKILWIPQGTFYLVGTASIVVNNVTVEGAGYLYSEIYRDVPLPNNTPLGSAFQCYSCHLENFHIDSDAMSRAEVDGGGGAEDTTGTNWVISGMWVQHVESSLWASGSGGTVENNFFTVDLRRRLQPEQRLADRHFGQQPDRDQQLHPRYGRRRHGHQLRRLQRKSTSPTPRCPTSP